jgi:xylulokinase
MVNLLGIDLGTSSVRVSLVDVKGTIVDIAQRQYQFEIPRIGWAEQDPEIWWQSTVSAIQEIVDKNKGGTITGIGFSGQMHSLVTLDKKGCVLRKSIIWCDKRSQKQVDEIYDTLGKTTIADICHSPVACGFLLPSLLWVKENEPHLFENIDCVLLPKDYIRYRLTGRLATEVSDASGTLAFDINETQWSKKILTSLGLPLSIFPQVGIPSDIGGYITEQAARETHLQKGIPCVLGGADQVMQAVGNGIIEPGTASVTIGTGGQILSVLTTPIIDKTLSSHCFSFLSDQSWYFLGASLNGGYALKWVRTILGNTENYQEIDKLAETINPGGDNLIFLPYLNGERTPYMDSMATGLFIGLTSYHTKAHIYRAVMEGITFAMRDCFQVLLDNIPSSIEFVIASGGASQSPLWLQIEANVLNRPVYISAMKEQASVGAAFTAGVGTGIFTSFKDVCTKNVNWSKYPVLPQSEYVQRYNSLYLVFKELYQNNKLIMHRLVKELNNNES